VFAFEDELDRMEQMKKDGTVFIMKTGRGNRSKRVKVGV
jgi:hypothetical protein